MQIDPLGYRLYRLRREVRRHWPGVLLALVLFYFAFHTIHGQRGLFAWIDRQHELELKRLELADLQQQRAWLERRVAGLAVDQLDPDLLAEELYRLGFVRRDEVVILETLADE